MGYDRAVKVVPARVLFFVGPGLLSARLPLLPHGVIGLIISGIIASMTSTLACECVLRYGPTQSRPLSLNPFRVTCLYA